VTSTPSNRKDKRVAKKITIRSARARNLPAETPKEVRANFFWPISAGSEGILTAVRDGDEVIVRVVGTSSHDWDFDTDVYAEIRLAVSSTRRSGPAARLRHLLARCHAWMNSVRSTPTAEERAAQDLEAAADRTAGQPLASITSEMTLANKPLEVRFPDSGYGPNDFADDHSEEAIDRFEAHLRAHQELRALDKWKNDYAGLDLEDTHDSAAR
jgi:hypothetical protein